MSESEEYKQSMFYLKSDYPVGWRFCCPSCLKRYGAAPWDAYKEIKYCPPCADKKVKVGSELAKNQRDYHRRKSREGL